MGMKPSLYLSRNQCLFSLSLLEWRCITATIIDEALFYFVVNCLIRDCIFNPWFLSELMIAHPRHSALLVCLSSHRSMKNQGGGWDVVCVGRLDLCHARPTRRQTKLSDIARANEFDDWLKLYVNSIRANYSKSPKTSHPLKDGVSGNMCMKSTVILHVYKLKNVHWWVQNCRGVVSRKPFLCESCSNRYSS